MSSRSTWPSMDSLERAARALETISLSDDSPQSSPKASHKASHKATPNNSPIAEMLSAHEETSDSSSPKTVSKVSKQRDIIPHHSQPNKSPPFRQRQHSKSDPVRLERRPDSPFPPKEIQEFDYKLVTPDPSPPLSRKQLVEAKLHPTKKQRKSDGKLALDPADDRTITVEKRTKSLINLLHRKHKDSSDDASEMDPYKRYRLVLFESPESPDLISRQTLPDLLDDLSQKKGRDIDQVASFCYRRIRIKDGNNSVEIEIDPKSSIYEPSKYVSDKQALFTKILDTVQSSGCLKECPQCDPPHRIELTLKALHDKNDKRTKHDSTLVLKTPEEPLPMKMGELFFSIFKSIYSFGYTSPIPSAKTIKEQVSLLFNTASLSRGSSEADLTHQYNFLSPLIPAYPLLYAMTPSSIACARRTLKKAIPVLHTPREKSIDLSKQTKEDGHARFYLKCTKKDLSRTDKDKITVRILGKNEALVTHRLHFKISAIVLSRYIHDPYVPDESKSEKYGTHSNIFTIGEIFIDYILQPILESHHDSHRERQYEEKHPHPLYSVEIRPSKLTCFDHGSSLKEQPEEIQHAVAKALEELKTGFKQHLAPKKYEFEGNVLHCERK